MHELIKTLEVLVLQLIRVSKVETPTTMLITPLIQFCWKIDPLWMSKLIADKVQVALASQAKCDQTDHLMQSHPAINDRAWWACFAHVGIHLGIHKPKGYRFVPC